MQLTLSSTMSINHPRGVAPQEVEPMDTDSSTTTTSTSTRVPHNPRGVALQDLYVAVEPLDIEYPTTCTRFSNKRAFVTLQCSLCHERSSIGITPFSHFLFPLADSDSRTPRTTSTHHNPPTPTHTPTSCTRLHLHTHTSHLTPPPPDLPSLTTILTKHSHAQTVHTHGSTGTGASR